MARSQPHSAGMPWMAPSARGRPVAALFKNADALSNTWAPRLSGASWIAIPVCGGWPAASAGGVGRRRRLRNRLAFDQRLQRRGERGALFGVVQRVEGGAGLLGRERAERVAAGAGAAGGGGVGWVRAECHGATASGTINSSQKRRRSMGVSDHEPAVPVNRDSAAGVMAHRR